MKYTTASAEPLILQLSSCLNISDLNSTTLSWLSITAIARWRHVSITFLSYQHIDLCTSTEKTLQKALFERWFSLAFHYWKASCWKAMLWRSLCLVSVSLLNLCLLHIFCWASAFRWCVKSWPSSSMAKFPWTSMGPGFLSRNVWIECLHFIPG